MSSPNRDLSRALIGALVLAAVVLLVFTLKLPGLMLSALLIIGAILLVRRVQIDPEVLAIRSSLQYARDDIAEVLDAYELLQHGASASDIADRTLHYPALANPDNSVPQVNEFLLRASSARRFLERIDGYLESTSTDKAQLERILTVADERAFELQEAWDDARRAAKDIGPA
ncbi:hypothetical protein [Corynebacterium haemomassiliense]|uniref:Uncharacterized protein n=1 Tax=Corynebacterium haemomassiliense TaxID=2754726 RepID=A0A7W2EA21_9CORY|nr:hypothetical protein [Corynebacterium haemomassiliense]MBA5243898.1 hypothetical protein [Corynebacterium haemomassiliense]